LTQGSLAIYVFTVDRKKICNPRSISYDTLALFWRVLCFSSTIIYLAVAPQPADWRLLERSAAPRRLPMKPFSPLCNRMLNALRLRSPTESPIIIGRKGGVIKTSDRPIGGQKQLTGNQSKGKQTTNETDDGSH
jgi:hypothetical protein